ncbi:hypothetical protein PENFLA_c011G08967 [Penicillium flavigenum]|uniref:Subtelomeric hrmA-associated cluster protein AFUB-079030/YDR124W-like helical bundle domain-containing protein n=1 Tax=Penicillium flavigenum TaxID=254877 RepID=A0A1V6TBD4_9EURO|nr:hypothetical protein PENFLA_c011G08967 [Penicillium flavigenum]
MACHTHVTIDGEPGPSHFALISIDIEGGLHLRCSRSIAKTFQGSLSVRLADIFLKAVTMSGEACSAIEQAPPRQTTLAIRKSPSSPRITHIAPRKTGLDGRENTRNFPPASLPSPTVESAHTESLSPWDKQTQQPTKRNVWSDKNRMWRPEVTIPITDRALLRKYYEKAFQNLQQTNCRALAKAYIKLVEPRKQMVFPYNGRIVVTGVTQQLDPEATKPPWWPRRVRHREPDHLLKEERIRLLIHILCELRTSRRITARKLREADQAIRRHIFPAERLCILDEIYRVRREEENFLEGKSDGQRPVWICRMNLPEAKGTTFNHNERIGESVPLDSASPISNTTSACVNSGSNNNAPPASFAPVSNFPDLSLDHPYDAQGHFPGQYYAGLDPKTINGFDMAVPMSMPPQRLKRKRESEEASHVDSTRPISRHDFSPPATVHLQPYPVEYPSESYNFLQQGFVSPGLSTTEALAQPKEGRDISYHFGY